MCSLCDEGPLNILCMRDNIVTLYNVLFNDSKWPYRIPNKVLNL